jgi:hypothetical protein
MYKLAAVILEVSSTYRQPHKKAVRLYEADAKLFFKM